MKYKYVLTYDWNFRGPEPEHYEHIAVQPYRKELEEYIGYNCIGGAGADGVEIYGYKTAKEFLKNIRMDYIKEVKFFNFNKKQKRHLNKVINQIKKEQNI